jgi:iron(III) transport system ATP-binding protein
MTGPRFEFRAVSKRYEEHAALVEVSFAVSAGEHLALLGPSGSGKSTALRLLAGLEGPSDGEILLDGQVASRPGRIVLPPHRRGVAMVFQDLALWPNLTVFDNVLLGLAGAQLSRRQARARAREALAWCGIDALADRKPGQISGGEQQRVALARATAPHPRFLLLDEPFSGLDLVIKTRLLKEIAALAREQCLTVLLVSHDPMDAVALCRAAIVLEGGQVTEAGILTDLLNAPRSEILKAFQRHLGDLAPCPNPDTRRARH